MLTVEDKLVYANAISKIAASYLLFYKFHPVICLSLLRLLIIFDTTDYKSRLDAVFRSNFSAYFSIERFMQIIRHRGISFYQIFSKEKLLIRFVTDILLNIRRYIT
jgi:hypothetical protein